MSIVHTNQLHGYSVQFSPFVPQRLACAACQQFGISGSGSLIILEFNEELAVPPVITHTSTWPDGLFDICWSELNEDFCVTAGGDGSIQLWNISNQEPVSVMRQHEKEVYSIDWSNTDRKNLVVSGSWDTSCVVWDVESGGLRPISSFAGHQGVVYSVVWSPYLTQSFASTCGDGMLRIWDVRKPSTPEHAVAAHSTEVLSCDWSKYDPNIMVTGSVDCSIKVWDLRNSRTCLCQMVGHNYAVRRVKCSPFFPGVVASCSYDFTVRTWNYLKPQGLHPLLETIEHHKEFVYGVDFSTFVPGLVADCAWDESIRLYKPLSLINCHAETENI